MENEKKILSEKFWHEMLCFVGQPAYILIQMNEPDNPEKFKNFSLFRIDRSRPGYHFETILCAQTDGKAIREAEEIIAKERII